MKYFGTDGIRGKYALSCVNEEFFSALGIASAKFLKLRDKKGCFVVGRDTRSSGKSLAEAFISGLSKGGVVVEDLGILPTPALAYGVLKKGAAMGAMITASHNPYTDNGIKFFDENARKIEDDVQLALETIVDEILSSQEKNELCAKLSADSMQSGAAGTFVAGVFAMNDYAEKMSSIFPKNFLSQMKIALDSANGAMSGIAAKVMRSYGAEVFCVGDTPDGVNINSKMGSQHPESIAALCKKSGADIGFAFDGDGDRVVVCDENSEIVDGECVMGLIAIDAKNRNILKNNAIVTTTQSNMGMDASLKKFGINVYRSGIGDRLVMREMLEKACVIGGENSGHFIFSEISPCGDGLAAALAVLSALAKNKAKASSIKNDIILNPLLQCALDVSRKTPIEKTPTLAEAIRKCEKLLGSEGRVFVRYSGTEDKIRLLVESPYAAKNEESLKLLTSCVENDLK